MTQPNSPSSSPASPLPLLLLANDDGIDAPGMHSLRRAVENIGRVKVAAPAGERSASGHAITLHRDLPVTPRGDAADPWGWAIDGTPADCVKLGITTLLREKPALVLSGINHGMNAGNSILYSGTVGAATEAIFFDVPSIAFSMHSFKKEQPHWETGIRIARAVVPWVLRNGLPPRTVLNVNVPNLPFEQVRGIRSTSMGTSFWTDTYAPYDGPDAVTSASGAKKSHPPGTIIYRNIGDRLVCSQEPSDADDRALLDGFVSMTLLKFELTDWQWRERMASEIEWLNNSVGLSPTPIAADK